MRLTGTELRLLEVLMRAVGQVQSRESLTERVLGRRLTPYDRSIDTHVSNLRRKLGLGENGLPEIRSIRGAGYVLIATGEARARAPRPDRACLQVENRCSLRIFLAFWAAMLLVLLSTAAVAWYRLSQYAADRPAAAGRRRPPRDSSRTAFRGCANGSAKQSARHVGRDIYIIDYTGDDILGRKLPPRLQFYAHRLEQAGLLTKGVPRDARAGSAAAHAAIRRSTTTPSTRS